jgi:hypothetical protein
MHAIHARTHPLPEQEAKVTAGPFPWEEAHAAPEDQAVGLELELIELVQRRTSIPDENDGEAVALDREIDQTLTALGSITPLSLTG